MWDDTDSSITTSRVSTTWGKGTDTTPIKSKDMRRQGRNLLKMLHQIQADLLVKRELVGQLEKSEDQYTQMRTNYEQRLSELKEHLFEVQKQRDAALKKAGATVIPAPAPPPLPQTPAPPTTTVPDRPQSVLQLRENRLAQEVRSQYEVKMKLLVTENQELRKKHTQSTQAVLTARAKAEGVIGRLRADIEALKLDKKQLNKGLKVEVDKAREAAVAYEREIQQLKRRIAIAVDAKKKVEETNEAQNQVLKKRTEETAAANLQIRQLTNALRKAANEGTFLNEASLEKILETANLASAKTNARRSFIGNSRLVAGANPSMRTNSPTI
jgi:chromosome segregation ATPase